jgi:hypothetical protein
MRRNEAACSLMKPGQMGKPGRKIFEVLLSAQKDGIWAILYYFEAELD